MNKPINLFILNTPNDNWEEYLIKDFKKKGIIKTSIVQKTGGESKKKFLNLGKAGLQGEYRFVPSKIYNKIYVHLFKFMDI